MGWWGLNPDIDLAIISILLLARWASNKEPPDNNWSEVYALFFLMPMEKHGQTLSLKSQSVWIPISISKMNSESGAQLVIPRSMRRELMSVIHDSHIGIEGSIRRARETIYWQSMSSKLKECISKCDICMAHCSTPGREPLLQHEFAARPWARPARAKVAADLANSTCRVRLFQQLHWGRTEQPLALWLKPSGQVWGADFW
jgi:hypothetical protein